MRPAANPFATPFEILPDWYLFGTFNLLRILSDKFMGILSTFMLASVLLVIPVFENLSTNQNPIRRAGILSIFLSAAIIRSGCLRHYEGWLFLC